VFYESFFYNGSNVEKRMERQWISRSNAVSFIRFHPDHPAYPRVLRNYLSGGSDIILPKSDPLFDQVIAVPHLLVAGEAEEVID